MTSDLSQPDVNPKRLPRSSDVPSSPIPRTSHPAPAGEGVRDALAAIQNLSTLMRYVVSAESIQDIKPEVEAALASLREAFRMTHPELTVFATARIERIEALLGLSTRGVEDEIAAEAIDLGTACELRALWSLVGKEEPTRQTLDSIVHELVHWRPLAAEGIVDLSITLAALQTTIECAPWIAAPCCATIVSLIDSPRVEIDVDGRSVHLTACTDARRVGVRTIPRLHRIDPVVPVLRDVLRSSGVSLATVEPARVIVALEKL